MKTETHQKALWCALFTCTAIGPYRLGMQGETGPLVASGTYAFVALGILLGLWATCYPNVATRCANPTIWRRCVYGGLALMACLEIGGWIVPVELNAAGKIPARALAFAVAFLCGATSLQPNPRSSGHSRPTPRVSILNLLVLAATFGAAFLRPAAYGVLFTTPWGVLLLGGCLFEWALCIARGPHMRRCLGALALGELTYRAAERFGFSLPPGGHGLADLVLLLAAAALTLGAIVSRLQAKDVASASLQQPPTPGATLAPWMRTRLSHAGLTARELDVLATSLDGCTSTEAAQRLALQPSTVRTYKGRICKKLGIDSFDRVLGAHGAQIGPFEPPHRAPSATTLVPTKRPVLSSVLRLTGCLSLFMALLMPQGTLPFFWNSTWVMAYAVAAGVLTCLFPVLLQWLGLRPLAGSISPRTHSWGFALCATACCALRLTMELNATGFGPLLQMALFWFVTGFVGFGLEELHRCIGSPYLSASGLGAAVACTMGCTIVASITGPSWYGALGLSLLLYIGGALLQPRNGKEPSRAPETRPTMTATWFVIACIWEECWRGVSYLSLQDLGLPFLAVLMAFDAVMLCRQAPETQGFCILTVAGSLLLGFERGLTFALLTSTVLLEIQVQHAQAQPHPRTHETAAPPPPSLLGIAAGCCAAVYGANARGTHILAEDNLALVANLDWVALGFFAATLIIVLGRIAWPSDPYAPSPSPVDSARLEGYLVGKGLTEGEVKVCMALARGESASQIAETLSYSAPAIHAAKRSAFSKLGVANRHQYMAALWRELDVRPVAPGQ